MEIVLIITFFKQEIHTEKGIWRFYGKITRKRKAFCGVFCNIALNFNSKNK